MARLCPAGNCTLTPPPYPLLHYTLMLTHSFLLSMATTPLCQGEGFLGTEGLVEGAHLMRIEIVLHEVDLLRLWLRGRQSFHDLCVVRLRPLSSDLNQPLARLWCDRQSQGT
jgi:hypothetical protein